MQSTASVIAAAAISGADLEARASQSTGAAGGGSNVGGQFDSKEADSWLNARWKTIESTVSDPTLSSAGK